MSRCALGKTGFDEHRLQTCRPAIPATDRLLVAPERLTGPHVRDRAACRIGIQVLPEGSEDRPRHGVLHDVARAEVARLRAQQRARRLTEGLREETAVADEQAEVRRRVALAEPGDPEGRGEPGAGDLRFRRPLGCGAGGKQQRKRRHGHYQEFLHVKLYTDSRATVPLRTRAVSRSSTRSSADSRPTERRIRFFGAANGASAVEACVIRAGCSIRLSTPPSDSASLKTFVRATSATASSSVSTRKEIIPPKSRICLAAIAWPGCVGKPGYRTCCTDGCCAKRAVTTCAFSQCWRMRTASVLMPRSTSQQSNGPGTAPSDFWRNCRRSAMVGSFVAANPPTTSECPPRYFVVEWMTMSAPSSSGRCRYGVANVLSTTTIAPALCAASAAAWMSITFRSGFVGVSSQTIRVRSSRCSARSWPICEAGTQANS